MRNTLCAKTERRKPYPGTIHNKMREGRPTTWSVPKSEDLREPTISWTLLSQTSASESPSCLVKNLKRQEWRNCDESPTYAEDIKCRSVCRTLRHELISKFYLTSLLSLISLSTSKSTSQPAPVISQQTSPVGVAINLASQLKWASQGPKEHWHVLWSSFHVRYCKHRCWTS